MRIYLFTFSLVFSSLVYSQDCNDNYTPEESRFVNNEDGTVSDTKTGLMWQQCVYGQTWDGDRCQGLGTSTGDLAESLSNAERDTFKGYFDWRIPNIKELYSLVNTNCRPAFYQEFVPYYSSDYVYSSSTVTLGRNINNPISVYFFDGSIRSQIGVGLIRLVRYDD